MVSAVSSTWSGPFVRGLNQAMAFLRDRNSATWSVGTPSGGVHVHRVTSTGRSRPCTNCRRRGGRSEHDAPGKPGGVFMVRRGPAEGHMAHGHHHGQLHHDACPHMVGALPGGIGEPAESSSGAMTRPMYRTRTRRQEQAPHAQTEPATITSVEDHLRPRAQPMPSMGTVWHPSALSPFTSAMSFCSSRTRCSGRRRPRQLTIQTTMH